MPTKRAAAPKAEDPTEIAKLKAERNQYLAWWNSECARNERLRSKIAVLTGVIAAVQAVTEKFSEDRPEDDIPF